MSYRLPATVSLLMAVLLPSLVGGCGHQTEASPALPIPVTVRDLRPNNAPENVRYSANIQPNTQVSLAFQVTGYVDQITQVPGANGKRRSIQSGDFVRKGTLLATIHSDLYQRQLDNAEAQVEGAIAQQVQSKADLDRFTKLLKQAIISQAQYDASLKASQAADSQLKSARAALEQAKINLGYCKLYAPMDGLILSRDIEPGTLAGPGVTAFEIADTDEVKAVFGVSDSVVKDLRMGEPLSIKTRAYPNESFPGTISRIAPNADPTTRVFDIEVTIANADGRQEPGWSHRYASMTRWPRWIRSPPSRSIRS